jgi:hypothetical protein
LRKPQLKQSSVGFALIVLAIALLVAFVADLGAVLPPGRSVVAFVSGGCAASLLFAANACGLRRR